MSYSPLELVIQSAQGLKYVTHVKKNETLCCSFHSRPQQLISSIPLREKHRLTQKVVQTLQGTSTFSSPSTLLYIAQENHLDLVVKLKSRRKSHGIRDKDIGEVRVLISELLKCFGDDDYDDAAEDEKHMSKSIVTSDDEAQGALAFSYKFGRTVDHPPTDPNVKQRPKRGANGFAGQFFEGLGKGLGLGLMDAVTEVGKVILDDDDQPDDDDEDEYS